MSEEESSDRISLDLSKRSLKKVPKQEDAQNVRILILDENELQKIDNIDSYLKIESLSLSKNQLLRMYGVCRLHCLRELNLSFNGILTIEGLKELVHLRHLNLEGNNIKTIEHLNTNIKLEYLNLSENSIGSISDISFLKCLKELYLHGNRLTHLRQCEKYLPTSIEVLSLAKNNISDLNEICSLSNLCNLHSITINENPCVSMTSGQDGFNHRPFVLNWCMSVKVIDGFMVDPIESLKAEWLYSQGRGRQFRLGEQASLGKYLSTVCPMLGKALESENERKLRLILSKAQQHQRQLQEEISENSTQSGNNSPSTGRKKPASRIQSPRFSRLTGRQGSPDSMASSYHGNTSNSSIISNEQMSNASHLLQMTTSLIENIKNDSIMTQSFDSNSTNCNSKGNTTCSSQDSTPRTITPNQYNDQPTSTPPMGGPLAAASKMVPVPETLMSPDCCPGSVAHRVTVSAMNNQVHNSKVNKNKENKMSSPKMRSPHLKRNAERSPTLSPRKLNNNANSMRSNLINDNQIKQRLMTNSVHVTTPDVGSTGASSDDDSDHINVDKLKTIRNKAAQRCQQQKEIIDISNVNTNHETESSAVVIQKIWRGYRTRKKTKDIAEKLLKKRTQEYIELFHRKLTKDMEMTKAQLENERKIQQLQMQAINALWKKVSTMQGGTVNVSTGNSESTDAATTANNQDANQPSKTVSLDNSSTAVVNDLAKTCTMLTTQVQQLQGSMRDILNCLTVFCNLPQENLKQLITSSATIPTVDDKKDSAATQTEIVAVHTPQIENQSSFPFKIRPSTLTLETNETTTKIILNQSISENDEGSQCENSTPMPSSAEKVDEEKSSAEDEVGD
ncbi:centrosomal protein of 97 kDa isoform X1 [Eupeodes corollae]|uniref:centrosomal protein of 97 kDa isoform X1 n=1 Tax=Eupeodes corollae TaxID=290404 RepID=UPI002492B7D3|nr:centrosomal protein of 97 kDa isoform X1 [Eupeodes corollae]